METMDHHTTEDPALINRLSNPQEAVLSFLPIPSAILSICGSCTIIYVALKEKGKKKWTPYARLLLGLSISDIIVSATISGANFLRPRGYSVRYYAFGNDATCSTIGFLNQIGTSAFWYNAMLAIYFVLTARFGYKNSYISQCIEPFMHFISVGYPLMAAAVGSVIEIWGEMPVNALGCYIPDCNTVGHISHRLSLMFYAVPMASAFILLFCCNCIVAVFVWRNTRSTPISSDGARDETCKTQTMKTGYEATKEFMSSSDNTKRKLQRLDSTLSESKQHQKMQNSRLRLVGSQAILYVGCFFLSYVWIAAIKYLVRTTKTKQEEINLLKEYYALMVFEAIFHPSQGFFNMLVFLRPKFWKARQQYPEETKMWAARRSIFGEEIEPSFRGQTPSSLGVNDNVKCSPNNEPHMGPPGLCDYEEKEEEKEKETSPPPNNPVATASLKEMEWDSNGKTRSSTGRHRTQKISHNMWSTPISRASRDRGSSLQVISEISASFFEPIDVEQIEETKASDADTKMPTEESEHRWNPSMLNGSGDKWAHTSASSFSPIQPERADTDIDLSFHEKESPVGNSAEQGGAELFSSHRSSSDTPIMPPLRRMSPTEMMMKNDVESLNRWQ